jgi:hypothetical protein
MPMSTRRRQSLLLGIAAIVGGLLLLHSWQKKEKPEPKPTVLEQIVRGWFVSGKVRLDALTRDHVVGRYFTTP